MADGLNLPDIRVDPDCWLRSGFESPRRQLGFKPLSGSHPLRTLHCRATLICASFEWLIIYYHFFSLNYFTSYLNMIVPRSYLLPSKLYEKSIRIAWPTTDVCTRRSMKLLHQVKMQFFGTKKKFVFFGENFLLYFFLLSCLRLLNRLAIY